MAGPAFSFSTSYVRPVPNGALQVITSSLGQLAPGGINGLGVFASNRYFDTAFGTSGGVGIGYVPQTVVAIGKTLDVRARCSNTQCLIRVAFGDIEAATAALLDIAELEDQPPVFVPDSGSWTGIRGIPIVSRFVHVFLENIGAAATTSWHQMVIIRDGVS